jgi:hypothetical protein
MSVGCTLVLTQGIHVIDEDSAVAVEQALEKGARSVDVSIDMTGSGNVISKARISMIHVIAVVRHPAISLSLDLANDSKVYAFARR